MATDGAFLNNTGTVNGNGDHVMIADLSQAASATINQLREVL